MGKPDGMMGMKHAALPAQDLARATAFYRDVLGFTPYYDGDADWTMLRSGATSVSLVLSPNLAPSPTDGSHPAHLGLTFDAPQSVDGFYKQLTALKTVVTSVPRWHRDKSYGFYFQDTEGNNLEAIFIPFIPVAGPRDIAGTRGLLIVTHSVVEATTRRLLADCRRQFPHTRVEAVTGTQPALDEAIEALFADDSVLDALIVPMDDTVSTATASKRPLLFLAPLPKTEPVAIARLEAVAEALDTPRKN